MNCSEQSSIKTQITKFDLSVEAFVRCVSSLNEELFMKKLDNWSPRDILAHLIGWNRYIIEGSQQIKRRELPFYDIDPGKDYCKVNAVLIRKYSSGDRQKLLDELKASAQELKQFLQTLGPGEWNRDYGVRHQGVAVTIQNSVVDLIEDYSYHVKQINEWQKW